LSDPYIWFKALHIMSFAAWMAAMWYLPRLMVYHADQPVGSETSELFKVMERRLLKAIGTPAMISTFVFGLLSAHGTGAFSEGWFHLKLLLVIGIGGCHGILARHVRLFAQDERSKTAVWYRFFNEVPTVLFIVIVILAVFRPSFW
jgi:putative membrane protein